MRQDAVGFVYWLLFLLALEPGNVLRAYQHVSRESSGRRSVTIRLVPPKSDEDWRQARRLIEQYAASLDVDLSFQNFEHANAVLGSRA